jgi:hypothetical protein
MKRVFPFFVLLSVCAWTFSASATADVPHRMFYQGHLTDEEGAPLDTVISMTFTIYDDSTGGVAWWSETQDSVTVAQGLFNVVLGSVNAINDSVFMSSGRWLGLAIGFDPEITPRTELVAVPWAFRVGALDGASGGMIDGGMEVLGNVDASGFSIEGVPVGTSSDSYWSQSGDDIFYNLGNVGVGTITPAEALDVQGNVHASGALISGSSITIDGATDQITATSGRIDFDDEDIVTTGKATIGPGNSNTGVCSFVAGMANSAGHDFATVGGGLGNTASGQSSTVAGGSGNTASGFLATVGGGDGNNASDTSSTVSGGFSNAAGKRATVGGGLLNEALGEYAAIGGGNQNLVEGDYSAVLGGYANAITATADYSYLFGIGSSLDEDSTFMVDLPHIFLQGEIWQANSDGDTICELSSFSTGGGFIGTYGPNGNLNTALTILDIGEEDHGGVGVANEDGEWRALMYSDSYYSGDRGVVETYGPNGNINLKLWNALVDENAGCVSVADAAGEYRGHFLVTDDSAGWLTLRGPNDYLNVVLRNVEGDPNAGSMGVCDNDGWMRAEMFVDEYGQGIVAGDQKSFRVPNPNQPGTDIWYCCLEGPEAAAYVRGTGHLVNGRASVALPDHFTAVASSKGITVQVTPLSGESKGLAVVEKGTDRFAVRELNNGSGNYDFDFMVTAVRKGHEDYQVIRASIETKPVDRGATRDDSPVQLMKTPGR